MAKGACVVKGGCACQRGACVVKGGMCGGGMHGKGELCVAGGRGACMAGEMATAADGMHPTGIRSYSIINYYVDRLQCFNLPRQDNYDGKQECIPVGCIPATCCPYLQACTARGGCTWS